MTGLLRLCLVLAVSGLAAMPVRAETPEPRILVMGDSLLAMHKFVGQSVGQALKKRLGEPVMNMPVKGARMNHIEPLTGAIGLKIPMQFRKGDWDWIIVNGGGNDLLFGCGCGKCQRVMSRLITEDGTRGTIPVLLKKLRDTGANVIYVGYLRTPGRRSLVDSCAAVGNRLEGRVADLARRMRGVYYLSNRDLVPEGDLSFHALDRIHPSFKGSKAIAARIADLIARADPTR